MNKKELGLWLEELGFLPEVKFRGMSGTRRYKWDWAKEDIGIAIEYQGKGGGHQSYRGVERDYEKLNNGQLCGFIVIQCSAQSCREGKCQEWIEIALEQREGKD